MKTQLIFNVPSTNTGLNIKTSAFHDYYCTTHNNTITLCQFFVKKVFFSLKMLTQHKFYYKVKNNNKLIILI